MKIRPMTVGDIDNIRMIHEQFYKDEFEFPNFAYKYAAAFVVEDDEERIITAGGVRAIAESVLITNKHLDIHARVKALYKALDLSEFVSRHEGYEQLHAFVMSDDWSTQLMKHGFRPMKGQGLVFDL